MVALPALRRSIGCRLQTYLQQRAIDRFAAGADVRAGDADGGFRWRLCENPGPRFEMTA